MRAGTLCRSEAMGLLKMPVTQINATMQECDRLFPASLGSGQAPVTNP